MIKLFPEGTNADAKSRLSTYNLHLFVFIDGDDSQFRGVGTGPAGPATAGPKFPEPTIKNIIPLFVIKQIRNFYITVACLYDFNKGIILLYY